MHQPASTSCGARPPSCGPCAPASPRRRGSPSRSPAPSILLLSRRRRRCRPCRRGGAVDAPGSTTASRRRQRRRRRGSRPCRPRGRLWPPRPKVSLLALIPGHGFLFWRLLKSSRVAVDREREVEWAPAARAHHCCGRGMLQLVYVCSVHVVMLVESGIL